MRILRDSISYLHSHYLVLTARDIFDVLMFL